MSRKKKNITAPKSTIAESLGLSSKPLPPSISLGSMRFVDDSPMSEQIVRNLLLSLGEGDKNILSTPSGRAVPEEGKISPRTGVSRIKLPTKSVADAVELSNTMNAIPSSSSLSNKTDGPSHDRRAHPIPSGTPTISSNDIQQDELLDNNASNLVSPVPSALSTPSKNLSRTNDADENHYSKSSVEDVFMSALEMENQTFQSIPQNNSVFMAEGSDAASAFPIQSAMSTTGAQNHSDSDMEVDDMFPDLEPVTPVVTNMEVDDMQDVLQGTEMVNYRQEPDIQPDNPDIFAVADLYARLSNPIDEFPGTILRSQDDITELGIWRVARGLSRPGISLMTFDVPAELADAARKWSAAHKVQLEQNTTLISVRLSCITNASISHLEDLLSKDVSQVSLANAVRDIPSIWPADLNFGVGITRGEELNNDNWTSIALPVLAESLDITSFISSGKITLRLLHAIALDDFTFILSALQPTAEEKHIVDEKAIRERDIQIFMDKLHSITIPRGASFKFPLSA